MSKSRSGLFIGTGGAKAFNNSTLGEVQSTGPENISNKNIAKGTIEEAIDRVSKEFPLDKNGNFGKRGKSSGVRVIESENQYDTAKKFYDLVSEGGVKEKIPGKTGEMSTLNDGTVVTYREITTTKDSPAVEINVKKNNKIIKIHFIKKEDK